MSHAVSNDRTVVDVIQKIIWEDRRVISNESLTPHNNIETNRATVGRVASNGLRYQKVCVGVGGQNYRQMFIKKTGCVLLENSWYNKCGVPVARRHNKRRQVLSNSHKIWQKNENTLIY